MADHYNLKDIGCKFSPSCLSCHLEHCVEDVPMIRQSRNRNILNLYSHGFSISQLAILFNLSTRTIERVCNPTKIKLQKVLHL